MVSSLLYALIGVVATRDHAGIFEGWPRGTVSSVSGMIVAAVVVFVLIVAGCAAVALKVKEYVGDPPDDEVRERKVSAVLFTFFMLAVSAVSVWLGMQDISVANKASPISFWLAIPPASALVIVSHPERWQDKLICGLLSLGAYSMVCALKFWFVTGGILRAALLSYELFDKNYVINWYVVAFVCGFLTNVTNMVFIAAVRLLKGVLLVGSKLGSKMEEVMRRND